MTRSLNNELLEDKMWEADLYTNKHEYRSISKYG